MTLNPELRRNFWLELTPQRLIAMPVVLGLIFALAYTALSNTPYAVAEVARYIFLILAILWGTRRAAASIAGEVREGTWDWQRMSALEPWAMGWGKLFGSTSFAWYGGAICLVVYVAFQPSSTPASQILLSVGSLIGAGLLGQAVAMGAALAWLRKIRPGRRVPVTLCQVLGIVAGYSPSYVSSDLSSVPASTHAAELSWYGWQVGVEMLVTLSVLLFLGWALVGVWRMMQAELQVRMRPWAWLAFTVFAMVYVDGFVLGECFECRDYLAGWLNVPYVVAAVSLYLALFLGAKDVVRSRGLLAALRDGKWRRGLSLMPFSLPALLLFLLIGAVLVVVSLVAPQSTVLSALGITILDSDFVVIGVLAHFGFVLRDVCLLLALNFGDRRQRADMAVAIYLVVLYFLLPGIAGSLEIDWMAALFVPVVADWQWLSIFSAGVQALAALAFLARRWRRVELRLAPAAMAAVA